MTAETTAPGSVAEVTDEDETIAIAFVPVAAGIAMAVVNTAVTTVSTTTTNDNNIIGRNMSSTSSRSSSTPTTEKP
jgi:hypothetical protein